MEYRRFEGTRSGQLDRKSFKYCPRRPAGADLLTQSAPGVDGVRIKVGTPRPRRPEVGLGYMGLRGRVAEGPQHADVV